MSTLKLDLDNFVDSLDTISKDTLYRRLWLDYVKADVENQLEQLPLDDYGIESMEDEKFDELVDIIAGTYVYDGDYDCNLSYWENIDNLINRFLVKDFTD